MVPNNQDECAMLSESDMFANTACTFTTSVHDIFGSRSKQYEVELNGYSRQSRGHLYTTDTALL